MELTWEDISWIIDKIEEECGAHGAYSNLDELQAGLTRLLTSSGSLVFTLAVKEAQ